MTFTKKAWATAVAAIVLAGVGGGTALAQTSTGSHAAAVDEQAQLAQLYTQAKAEGGKLTVYMGGDAPGQWDSFATAFSAAYPGIKVNIVTDLSKYHDARIDNQIATHNLVADVAILQTVQDFTRWKSEGALLKYKPVGWNKIFANAKDKDGYWTGVFYGAFADMVNTKELPADPSSFKASDLLAAKFKNKLIFTYPNDDDAVLFDFKLTVEKYGWDWLRQLVAQNPTFLRGTPGSAAGVASGKYLATLGTSGNPTPAASIVLPSSDPFNTWVQHGAIFKDAPHKATAKLFLSWLTSQAEQKQAIASWTWSVRTDVAPPTGLKALSTYKNTNTAAFAAFMADRGAVERFRSQLELYVGQVTGADPADPTGTLGLTPGKL
jgi:ABC-type Fe3+ transport system substrate-binding protein